MPHRLDNGDRHNPLLVTALHTGMRKSELLNLKWSDIDFDQQTVTVQAKDDWHTKNYRSRTIQLTPVLYDVLQAHRKEQRAKRYRSVYIFTYNGKRIKRGVRDSLRAVLKKAKLRDVTLHTLRHTFASQLVMAGVEIAVCQWLRKSYATYTPREGVFSLPTAQN